MPLFGSNKTKKTKKEETDTQDSPENQGPTQTHSRVRDDDHLQKVILRPRLTEKSTLLMEDDVYTFEVQPNATKQRIKEAMKAIYGVIPEKVRTVSMKSKKVRSRKGRTGSRGGGKKAYVYLKDGDSIDLLS